jgi:hypothetical protein
MKVLHLILLLLLLIAPVWPQAELEEKYAVWTMTTGRRWLTYHLEPTDVLRLKEEWRRIEESLAAKGDEFAGTYYQLGMMSGRFMIWSPTEGFVYVEYFDTEHPCYFSYGRTRAVGDEIHFEIDYESRVSICPPPKVTTPPKWIRAGDGEFFIPTTEAQRFGQFYSGLGEFNGFFSKWRGETFPFPRRWRKDPPTKTFVLPDGYRKYIRRPIDAKIIAVGKKRIVKSEPFLLPLGEKSSLTPVQINAGHLQGVHAGMQFVLLDDNDADSQTLKVTKVGRTTSHGIVLRQIADNGVEGSLGGYNDLKKDWEIVPFTPLTVGVKVTTSPIQKLPR